MELEQHCFCMRMDLNPLMPGSTRNSSRSWVMIMADIPLVLEVRLSMHPWGYPRTSSRQSGLGSWSSTAWKIYIRDNPTVRAEQQLAVLQMRLQLHSTISPLLANIIFHHHHPPHTTFAAIFSVSAPCPQLDSGVRFGGPSFALPHEL